MESSIERILAVLRRIPRGRVATYGQVAALAGCPRAPRLVVRALRREPDLPWHRVIGKRAEGVGRISLTDALGAEVQRQLLRKEGVRVDGSGGIDLGRFAWRPAPSRSRR